MLKDRISKLEDRIVGDNNNPASFANQIPSEIMYTICTCYGGLTDNRSINPDLDLTSFNDMAAVFSADTLAVQANFDGQKCLDALTKVSSMVSASVWADYDGKIYFARFASASSLDTVITEDDTFKLDIDIDTNRMTNRQLVSFNFNTAANSWSDTVTQESSVSVNSFGLREDTLKSENVWYTNSTDALNLTGRVLALTSTPPKKFKLRTNKKGLERNISETIRLVNSFFSMTSATAFRITEAVYPILKGEVTLTLDGALTLNGFFLDVDNQRPP